MYEDSLAKLREAMPLGYRYYVTRGLRPRICCLHSAMESAVSCCRSSNKIRSFTCRIQTMRIMETKAATR